MKADLIIHLAHSLFEGATPEEIGRAASGLFQLADKCGAEAIATPDDYHPYKLMQAILGACGNGCAQVMITLEGRNPDLAPEDLN